MKNTLNFSVLFALQMVIFLLSVANIVIRVKSVTKLEHEIAFLTQRINRLSNI